MATNRPFTVDPILTAVAIGYRNPEASRIADEVLPRMAVGAEKFKWTEYPLSEAFNLPDARVGRKGRVQQLEFGGEERTSAVEDYGLDSPIPNSDIQAAAEARARKVSSFDPEKHAVQMLTDTIANIREVRVAQMVQNSANYATGRKEVLSGTDQFSDYTNSDPITAIKDGMNSTLVHRPNTAVMGRDVWSALSSHPVLVNAVKGNVSSKGIISPEEFVQLFAGEGLKKVLIGDAWFNSAKPGQDVSLQKAWGSHLSLLHINRTATPEGGGISYGWTAEYGAKVAGRIEDEDIGLQGGFRIRTGERVKEEIVAKDVGYFFEDAV